MAVRSLAEDQKKVLALRGGPVLVSAGPGSGKTWLVVERLAAALSAERLAAERICAITFTVRAAGELRVRLRERLGKGGWELFERLYHVGTFHGLCAKLLRRYRPALYRAALEEATAALLRERAFRQALNRLDPTLLAPLAEFRWSELAGAITTLYLQLRSAGNATPTLPNRLGATPATPLVAALDALLRAFGDHYRALKEARGALDFDDLELFALQAIEAEEALRAELGRLALVTVDEFQDLNHRQWRLLEAVGWERVFAVGDERQAIYGFRYADVGLMEKLKSELKGDGRAPTLAYNRRAHPELVRGINRCFSASEGFAPLWAEREDPPPPAPLLELLLCAREPSSLPALPPLSAFAAAPRSRILEAFAVAVRLRELTEEGTAPHQIALLCRRRAPLPLYAHALGAVGLPVLLSAAAFWEDRLVAALLAHLRAVLNEHDRGALLEALASPLGGLSPAQLRPLAGEERWWEALAQGGGAAASYLAFLAVARKELQTAGLVGTLGAAAQLLPEGGGPAVEALLGAARAFVRIEGERPRAFLRYAALARELPEREQPGEVAVEAIRLLTIHGAKGLEFPVVAVCELGSAPTLRQPPLLVEGERLGVAVGEGGGPDADYEALSEKRRQREAAEERRLLYVALTRARERLLLSGSWPLSAAERKGRPNAPLGSLIERLIGSAPALGPAARWEREVRSGGTAEGECRLLLHLVRAVPAGGCAKERATPSPRSSLGPAAPAARHSPLQPLLAQRESLSYTALARLARCPLRFFAEEGLGLAPFARAGAGVWGRTFGTVLHALLAEAEERWAEEPDLGKRAARLAGRPLAPGQLAELAALLEVARGGPPGSRLGGLACRRELPFSFSLHDRLPPVVGSFDLYARRGEEAVVIDYKTDRPTPPFKPAERVAERYALQQLLYGLAALKLGAVRVEVVHWFLRLPAEPVRRFFKAQEREALAKRLAGQIAALAAQPLAPSPRPYRGLCGGCPLQGRGCPHPRALTDRPAPLAPAG